jgi:hypothetical protein
MQCTPFLACAPNLGRLCQLSAYQVTTPLPSLCGRFCTSGSPTLQSLMTNATTYAGTMPLFAGTGRCDDMVSLKRKYHRAPNSHSDPAALWYQSGVLVRVVGCRPCPWNASCHAVNTKHTYYPRAPPPTPSLPPSPTLTLRQAEMFIKIVLCNFILGMLHFVDPLAVHGGKYEVSDPTSLRDTVLVCKEVQTMLRLKGLLGVLLWGLLSLAALANLVYASSLGASGTWRDFNLSAIVVVSVAGALVLGALVWYSRRRCGPECRGCWARVCCCQCCWCRKSRREGKAGGGSGCEGSGGGFQPHSSSTASAAPRIV